MNLRRGAMVAMVGVLASVSMACGDDADETFPTTSVAVNLAEGLLTPADLGPDWSVSVMDDDMSAVDGAVSDEQQQLLPRPELCEQASSEARSTLETLRWQAFRSLELDVADPIRPPTDRTGHLVFLQELLSTGDVAQQRATFELLRNAYQACLGDIPAGEEGPGRADPFTLPALGDDRFGLLVTIEEAGGWAEWRIHQVMVLDGSTLLSLIVGDVRSMDVDPYFTESQIAAMVTTAIERIRSRTSP